MQGKVLCGQLMYVSGTEVRNLKRSYYYFKMISVMCQEIFSESNKGSLEAKQVS
jgi:hypothetical protein